MRIKPTQEVCLAVADHKHRQPGTIRRASDEPNSWRDVQRHWLQRIANSVPEQHPALLGGDLVMDDDEDCEPEQLSGPSWVSSGSAVPGAADAHAFHRQLRTGGDAADRQPRHVPDVHILGDAYEHDWILRRAPASVLGRQQRRGVDDQRDDRPGYGKCWDIRWATEESPPQAVAVCYGGCWSSRDDSCQYHRFPLRHLLYRPSKWLFHDCCWGSDTVPVQHLCR